MYFKPSFLAVIVLLITQSNDYCISNHSQALTYGDGKQYLVVTLPLDFPESVEDGYSLMLELAPAVSLPRYALNVYGESSTIIHTSLSSVR